MGRLFNDGEQFNQKKVLKQVDFPSVGKCSLYVVFQDGLVDWWKGLDFHMECEGKTPLQPLLLGPCAKKL
jgi:hypothetical protein